MFRIWQGKAILANIILPSIWLLFLKCVEENKGIINWLLLIITMLASCLVSSMGIPLAAITLGGLVVVFLVKDKKVSYLIKSGICVIPNIVYGLMYLIMK